MITLIAGSGSPEARVMRRVLTSLFVSSVVYGRYVALGVGMPALKTFWALDMRRAARRDSAYSPLGPWNIVYGLLRCDSLRVSEVQPAGSCCMFGDAEFSFCSAAKYISSPSCSSSSSPSGKCVISVVSTSIVMLCVASCVPPALDDTLPCTAAPVECSVRR